MSAEPAISWFFATHEDDERVVKVGLPAIGNPEVATGIAIVLANKKTGTKAKFGISRGGAVHLVRLLVAALESQPGDIPFIEEKVAPDDRTYTYIAEVNVPIPQEPKS